MSALPVRVLEAGARASAATSSTAINLILKLNPDTPLAHLLSRGRWRCALLKLSPPSLLGVRESSIWNS